MATTISGGISADIVFIIDNTGSMSGYISGVKNALTSFTNTLDKGGADYRLGLVEYGDLCDSSIKTYGFTERKTFAKWIKGIKVIDGAGADRPESGLEALNAAMSMKFRDGSDKRFIVITDADFHNQGEDGDGNPASYLSTAKVKSALVNSGAIMDVFGTYDACQSEWAPLAHATGGNFYYIYNLDIKIIAEEIINAANITVDLGIGGANGVFVVPTAIDETGKRGLTSDEATFKEAAEKNDSVVGNVTSGKNYTAVAKSPWGQIITVPENWTAKGTNRADTLNVTGNDVTASALGGNDEISNSGDNVTLDGGEDSDKIYNYGAKVSIVGGAGEGCDTVENYGDEASIITGAGMDKIQNLGNTVSIDAGVGNDTIINDGDSDKGNNARDVTIIGGKGDDSIINSGAFASINAGSNNDTIINSGDYATIIGYTDNDLINNGGTAELYGGKWLYRGSNVSINGGSGKNTINNGLYDGEIIENIFRLKESYDGGSKVTIVTGSDDDSIFNRGDEASISAGKGKNNISNGTFFGETVVDTNASGIPTFRILSSVKGGDDVTITAGSGDDTIQNFASSKVTIDAGDGSNQISLIGGGNNIYVKGGKGSDSIFTHTPKDFGAIDSDGKVPNDDRSTGSQLTVEAGGGKNVVSISSAWSDVTVEGGNYSNGMDVILSDGGGNILLKGNNGNDYIKNTSDNAVIFGGDHGDIIENYGNNVIIQGDNDKGAAKSTIGDYIITDKGNGVTIDGGKNADTITALHDVRASIVGGAGNDFIKLQRLSDKDLENIGVAAFKEIFSFLASTLLTVIAPEVVSSKALLTAINTAGNLSTGVQAFDIINKISAFAEDFTSTSTVAGGAGNDVIVSDGVAPRVFEYRAGDGNDTYHHFNDNKLGVDDFKLSTLDIKSGRISKIGVIGDDVTFVISDDKNKGSIKLVDGANKQFKLVEEAEGGNVFPRAYGINYDTKQIICSLFGSAADDVIQDNVGMERDKGTYIGDAPTDNDKIIHETNSLVIYGYGGDDNLRGNDKNDTIYGGAGADKLFGNGGNDVLDGGADADEIYGNDGKDTIHSHDYDTVHGGAGNDYIDNDGSGAELHGDEDKDKIINWSGYGVTIDGGDNNDTIEAHGERITVEGGAGDDSIRLGGEINLISDTNSRNMTVDAGADDDTVKSAIPDCTITGGTGNDLISLSAAADKNLIEYNSGDGHDKIYGLTNDDTLKIVSGNVDAVTVSGSDVVLTVGEGSLTFKKFAGKEFKVTHADDEVVKYKLSADKTTKEVTGSIIGGKGQTTVYGTSKSNTYEGTAWDDLIYGNGGNDIIYTSYGNNTIYGGDGNDLINIGFYSNFGKNTIYGGTGNDKIYTNPFAENLIIYNWGDGDDTVSGSGTLRILGAGYASVASLGNMIIEVGNFAASEEPAINHTNGRITLEGNAKGNLFNVEGNCLGRFVVNGISIDGKDILVFESFDGNAVDLTDFDEAIKLDASSAPKGLKLNGNELDNVIIGTAYNDTSTGGEGDNTFVMTGGKDVVTDYKSGRDKIFVDSEPSVSIAKSGSVVIKSGSNSLTLKKLDTENIDVDGKTITFASGTGETTKTYFTDKVIADENVTLNSAFKGTFDATNFKTVDASVVKVGLEIIGGSDSILGGKGNDLISGLSDNVFIDAGAGKDTIENYGANVSIDGGANNDLIYNYGSDSTLSGGAGNDSLWGSDGADTFRYSSGKDVIFGFDDNDLLEIVGTFKPSYNASANTIAFKVDSTASAITLKDFTATTFNINGESYQISGKTLIPK